MNKTLQVLIVEDSEDDTALLLRELRRGGYEPIHERVDTATAMKAALAKHPWDIIICDYSMPHLSMSTALGQLRESGLDLPFILVSGKIGEDTAVEAMKAGAHDYLLKGNLKRLVPAIERELREAKVRRERRQAEEQIQRHRQRQAALHDINLATTSTLKLDQVLHILLEKIDLLLPYAAATVRLFNSESGLLEPVACRNLDEKEWKAEQWRRDRGILNVVFERKAPWMVSNVQTDPRVRDPEFFRKHGLVSSLGVPLIVKEQILGVLGFYTKEEHEFSSEEVEFLTTLAGQAAIAIHNSHLYEQTKQQAGELERANKVKDEFLSVISHELRTPLNAVIGYTGMMKDKMLGEINPEQEKALGKVINRSKDLLSMIESILYVTSLEANAAKLESHEVNLSSFLSELRSAHDFLLGKNITINWDYPSELPSVVTDGPKLKHILQNLMDNAIKFTEKGHVTISARIKEGGRQQATEVLTGGSRLSPQASQKFLEFKVADTGIGIPKEFLPDIFEKFRQIDSSETRLYDGVGVGLYIVKSFTEMLGGKVEVESEPGKGSTFTVTIPCDR